MGIKLTAAPTTPPNCLRRASNLASRMSPSSPNSSSSQFPDSVAANQEISGHANQQHAVNHKHRRRPKPARKKPAHQTAERHAAAKGNHVNAHHPPTQIVGRDQL